MKKTFPIILIILLMLSGCSKQKVPVEDLSGYDISYKETFTVGGKWNFEWEEEGISVVDTKCYAVNYSTFEEIYEGADCVVLASPKIPYSEAEQIWHNGFGQDEQFELCNLEYSYSVRPLTVKKVLKGEAPDTDALNLYENVIVRDSSMRVRPGHYPLRAGDDYIMLLFKSEDHDDRYYFYRNNSVFSVYDSENTAQEQLNTKIYSDAKVHFADEIK